MRRTIKIYADGACIGNPGPGGWAFVILIGTKRIEQFGNEEFTTNNRMELLAVLSALQRVKIQKLVGPVEVFTDSQYVRDGITSWVKKWKRNGWRTANNKPVKNQDLWKQLDTAAHQLGATFNWIPGHSGIPENERCDVLSNMAARREVSYKCGN